MYETYENTYVCIHIYIITYICKYLVCTCVYISTWYTIFVGCSKTEFKIPSCASKDNSDFKESEICYDSMEQTVWFYEYWGEIYTSYDL